jgi:hypothetical protein
MNPDPMSFLKFVGIFISAMCTSLTLGQLASCVSHNLMIGLATRTSPCTCLEGGPMRFSITERRGEGCSITRPPHCLFMAVPALPPADSLAPHFTHMDLLVCVVCCCVVCRVAVPAVTMPMIMFSGLLYQRDSVPSYLAWLEKISIVNYTFSALLVEQVRLLHSHLPYMYIYTHINYRT